ncbi:MAG: lipocalin-like domain-containing protein, partial [Candidatus Promineifilaceae bacterium]
MKRLSIILIIFALLVAAGLVWWNFGTGSATAVAEATFLQVAEDTSGFARATEPNNIEFPRDLGAHDAYQTEWWYYTGNLEGENGRQFGYQFTIFR